MEDVDQLDVLSNQSAEPRLESSSRLIIVLLSVKIGGGPGR